MDTSPGVVIIVSLVLAIVLSACPATGAFSFPAGGIAATGIIAGDPGLTDNGNVSRVHAIDVSFNGKTVHANRGDILLVQLKEPDPARAWQFSGQRGFKVVNDVVPGKTPAEQDFKVRVLRSGDLSFRQIDSRDGYVINTFDIHVIIDQEKSGDNSLSAETLSRLRNLGQNRDAFRPWK